MKFERVKAFLKTNAIRVACAGAIMVSAAVAIMPRSYAAATLWDMVVEVPMYDPADGSYFLVQDRTVADECEKKYGWIRTPESSLNTHVLIKMTQHMTAEQAKYKAQFVFMAAGYDAATATAMVNSGQLASMLTASPDNWFNIAYNYGYMWTGLDSSMMRHVGLDDAEAVEKKVTGKVMLGTHQLYEGHENDTSTTCVKAAANTTTKTAGSAEEEVNQLYASLVASGKTPDQAMAEVNAQLASIIAKYAK